MAYLLHLFRSKALFRLTIALVVCLFFFNVGPSILKMKSISNHRSNVKDSETDKHDHDHNHNHDRNQNKNEKEVVQKVETQTTSSELIPISLSSNDQKRIDYDNNCDKYGEWETIDNNVFLRRTGAFYFIDSNLFNIHLLRRGSMHHNFSLTVTILENADKAYKTVATIRVNDTKLRHLWSTSKYFSAAINAHLAYDLSGLDLNSIEIKVLVTDKISGNTTKAYLNVKMKNLRSDFASKKSSMVCTKCLHLTKKDDFFALKWWIELNRIAGFEKIYLCDHAIENHTSFSDLFDEFKGFLTVGTLKCMPNIQGLAKYSKYKYLKSYKQMEWAESGKHDVTKMDAVNILIINECYMEHIDKYKFIAVYDIDEIVLTRLTSNYLTMTDLLNYTVNIDSEPTSIAQNKFTMNSKAALDDIKCNRYERDSKIVIASEKRSSFYEYLSEITKLNMHELSKPLSYFFNQAYFLDNKFIKLLFDGFEQELQKNFSFVNFKDINVFNISVNVTDTNREAHRGGARSFEFTIRSKREFQHAVNLLKMYKTIIRPYLDKYESLITNTTKEFDRFFAIIGHINNFALGKTLHDTRISFDLSLHYVENYFNISSEPPEIKFDKIDSRLSYFPHEFAHLSHYRKSQYFEYKQVPFEFLFLDLNYLNCYFIPVMDKFTKEKFLI